MTALADLTLKVSLLAACGLACAALLKRQPAALRHRVLAGTFLGVASLPLLLPIAPAWSMEPLTSALARQSSSAVAPSVDDAAVFRLLDADGTAAGPAAAGPAAVTGAPAGPAGTLASAVSPWIVSTWMAGVAVSLSILLVGLLRLQGLTRRSQPVTGPWAETASQLARRYGLRRPIRLVRGNHPSLLVTWGLRRAVVLIPPDAVAWTRERIQVVLAHELAHVKRGDWAVQMLAHVVRSIHWFNPLVWMAFSRLVRESEHACDDAVLDQGIEAPSYAGHLLDLARSFKEARPSSWPAAAMVRRCSLERRVAAMLNSNVKRHPIRRTTAAAATVLLVAVAVPIAGFQISGAPFHTLSGTVVDPQGRAVQGVTLTLANAERESTYAVRSDAGGRYEFVGLPSGEYGLRAEQFGFSTFEDRLSVGAPARRDIELQVGTVTEIVIADSGDPGVVRHAAEGEPVHVQGLIDECHSSTSAASTMGGRIRPPRKLKHVAPVYPTGLEREGVSETIQFEARIDIDGTVADLQALDPTAHPDLVAAAAEAVRRWRFEPTLLNCVPVDVGMRVSIAFRPDVTAR